MLKNILRPSPELGLEEPPKGCSFSEVQWECLGKAPEETAVTQSGRCEWGWRGIWGRGHPLGMVVSLCMATALACRSKLVAVAEMQPGCRVGLFCQVVAA